MTPDLSIVRLVLQASIPVQVVLALLALASLASWAIIFRKRIVIRRARREADQFENNFWSGGDLSQLYRGIESRGGATGMSSIFEFGFREFARSQAARHDDSGPAARERPARDARGAAEGDRSSGAEPRNSRKRRLDESVRGALRHGVGHHERLQLPRERAAGDPGDGGARHLRGAGGDRCGPVRRDSGGACLQPLRRPGGRLEIRYDGFMEEFSTVLQRHAPRSGAAAV